jgi:CBS domain-containing protein
MTTLIAGTHSQLADLSVVDAMHPGVLTCPRETPLRDVARMLASYNVHCVVVYGSAEEHEDGEQQPWSVISDLDLVAAALGGDVDDGTAGGAAASPVVFVSGRDRLDRGAQLMSENQVAHLVVVDPDTMKPVGILSTLDIAAALTQLPVRSGPPAVRAH